MPKTRKCSPLYAALVSFLWAISSTAQVTPTDNPAPNVPTPQSVLGHTPGDDLYLANYDESREYFHKLAAASNRVKLINVGKTTRGLEWEIAIISSPENLASLDKYKDISRKLADGRGLSAADAHKLARTGKAIVHIDGGLHSTEVAGAQQSIVLAYKLVSSQNDPEVDAILNNVILMLWPTLNPDGQNEVVAWYRKNVGTPYEVSPLPDLYQEYVGHDNNRDGYMNNMLESQDVTRTEIEWDPVIFYCHHQTAPFPTRIFIPPFVEPISSNIHPLMARWLNVVGVDIAAYLDEHNMPGAVHRVGFDNWYPGFLDFTHIFRNSISFFTETALFHYATPRFYPVEDFPKEQRGLRSEVFYSSPWKGGWWRLRDAVNYMEGASMAVLDTAAKYHEELLYNRYQAAADNVARFTKEPPYAYAIPLEQRDLPTAATLVQKLMINGIEVQQAAKPFHANGREYPVGTWVVLMDQPFSPLVKELFEPQQYPELRDSPTGPPKLPYDVTGWTLPMQMGVQVAPVLEPVAASDRAALHKLDQFAAPAGSLEGAGSAFALSHKSNATFKVINEALAAGGHVAFAPTETEIADGAEPGAIFVAGIDRDKFSKLAHDNSLKAKALAAIPKDAVSVKKARVGLYRAWVPIIDEGWTRWILENYGFAPITLRNGDIQAGSLRDRFDAIILPDASPERLRKGFGPGSVPGQYAGGIEEVGAIALREFVQAGGTLITFNNASMYAVEDLGLPVKNVLAGLKDEEFFCSGSLLRVEIQDMAHSAVWGLPHDPIVMFERGPAFETKEGFHGRILAAYPKDQSPLMSGYLLHPERIQGKATALEVQVGKGRVYLFGFRPQWRGQSHGAYKFFFNAIYESQGLSKPGPLIPVKPEPSTAAPGTAAPAAPATAPPKLSTTP
jgi:Zinc carboxypeptidase